MAYIRKREKKDGSVVYYAEIRIKRKGKVIYSEGRTFLRQILAKTWAAKRELELQNQTVFEQQQAVFIADIIRDYLNQFSTGRSKRFDLLKLIESDIAKINVYDLTTADLIKHCTVRAKVVKPQTVKNDLIWLKTVLETMKGVCDYHYSLSMFDPARRVLKKEGLIDQSDKRTRRPTSEELMKLSRYFYTKKPHYLHMMWFAIFSARRLSEICKLRWHDINHDNRTILVRDLKTPSKKQLSLRAKLPISAYKIISKQQQIADCIFPYNPRTVSSAFASACKSLNIHDLRFHDLRREACSRLADGGLTIEQIAMISLNESWASLKVYHKPDPGKLDI